jgi:hypothetical protein
MLVWNTNLKTRPTPIHSKYITHHNSILVTTTLKVSNSIMYSWWNAYVYIHDDVSKCWRILYISNLWWNTWYACFMEEIKSCVGDWNNDSSNVMMSMRQIAWHVYNMCIFNWTNVGDITWLGIKASQLKVWIQ